MPASKQTTRKRIAAILSLRETLVFEMAEIRRTHGTSRTLDSAEALLTRRWSAASWSARQDLLKAAAWLVRLRRRQADEWLLAP